MYTVSQVLGTMTNWKYSTLSRRSIKISTKCLVSRRFISFFIVLIYIINFLNEKQIVDELIFQAANASEIKKAFRRLSLQLHPDKNPAEDAEQQFRKVSNRSS